MANTASADEFLEKEKRKVSGIMRFFGIEPELATTFSLCEGKKLSIRQETVSITPSWLNRLVVLPFILLNIFSIVILFILAKYYQLAGIILSPLISSLFTEVWYFPFLLLKDIKYKISEVFAVTKEILLVLSLSVRLSSLFTDFSRTYNWYTFVLTVVIYTVISAFGFYYFSETFRSEFRQVLKKLVKRR